MTLDAHLIETFKTVVGISSPSGKENTVATWIEEQMKAKGWKVWRDTAGEKNDSNTGNVYAYLEVNPQFETVVFSAHMDTVQHENDTIAVQFDGETFQSDGTTILGADDKAGVTTLLLTAENLVKEQLSSNILFVFVTREEEGVMGSSCFEFTQGKIKYVFNVDSTDVPGVFIYKSLGYFNFSITIPGVSAHAAKAYEKGKNAISIAADLIPLLPQGRNLEEGWTLNIGTINGGHRTNVVCDEVILTGEIRGYTQEILNKKLEEVKTAILQINKTHQVTISIVIDKKSHIAPFQGKKTGELATLCEKACKEVHIPCEFKNSYSTSDANSYSGLGYEVISVSRGGKDSHAHTESIRLDEMVKSVELVTALCYLS